MMVTSDRLLSATGEFRLQRWPRLAHDPLQAWDAADEYLLQHIEGIVRERAHDDVSILVVNDAHGALATCLHERSPVSWSDSSLSHRASLENHRLNGIVTHPVQLRSTEDPSGRFDLVLIKVPKSTALLEDQLARLRPCLDASTIIIAAGMVKHLQKSAFSCFERYVGPLSTSLAHRKARLLFAQLDESRPVRPSPYPSCFHDSDVNITLVNHANVFSRDHLDHGARFLLTRFHSLPASEAAIDLGCGNGVLGIRLRQMMPAARIQFIDESYGAVASARENYRIHFPMDDAAAEFVIADALEHRPDGSADLVLCNPPFHQQHVLGDRIALSMFHGSSRCLAGGGELWIVANRHLAYSGILRQVFGNCTRIAGNEKYQILRSKKC